MAACATWFNCEFVWNPAKGETVGSSILEAIRQGHWDYEPQTTKDGEYISTSALPGSEAKLEILAERIAAGLPLWHPNDRITYDDKEDLE